MLSEILSCKNKYQDIFLSSSPHGIKINGRVPSELFSFCNKYRGKYFACYQRRNESQPIRN